MSISDMDASDRGSIMLVRNAKATPINPTVPIEHKPALRLRIAVSFAAIESLTGFRRRSTQRDRALLRSHFHFVSEIWHEVVPHANATSPIWRLRSGVPGEEHLSCSGRLLVSRGAAADVIDICEVFG